MEPLNAPEQSAPEHDIFPLIPGCLDKTLEIFERHNHPFILVGTLAGRWSSTNGMPNGEIDLLMRPSAIQPIVDDLVTDEWALCQNPHPLKMSSYVNKKATQDIWLIYRKEGYLHPRGLKYLRLWPEELYHLSTDCPRIEIPDILPAQMLTFEEEYYRDPLQRFGPTRLSDLEARSQPILPNCPRVRHTSRVPMFIPLIEHHINALLDQDREEKATKEANGNSPQWQIQNFIRYHKWDWPPASAWLLANKIDERNYELMKYELDRYVRKPLATYDPVRGVRTIYPWDVDPQPVLVDAETASTAHARLLARTLAE